jgi:hypothetical protein
MAKPVHALRDVLETARLNAIQELAAGGVTPAVSMEALRRVAFIQMALVAVREEITAHEPKGGEVNSLWTSLKANRAANLTCACAVGLHCYS